jgi:hypothetical protein
VPTLQNNQIDKQQRRREHCARLNMIETFKEAKSGIWGESASIVLLAVGGVVWSEHYLAEIGSGGPWHAAGPPRPHRCFRRLLPPQDQHNLNRSRGAGTLGRARRRRSKKGENTLGSWVEIGSSRVLVPAAPFHHGNGHTQPHARSVVAAADGGGVFGGGGETGGGGEEGEAGGWMCWRRRLWLPAFVAESIRFGDLISPFFSAEFRIVF